MRKALAVLAVAAVVFVGALAAPARASDNWVGTVTTADGTSKNNGTTSVTFTFPKWANVQADVAIYYRCGSDSTVTVTSSNGKKIGTADEDRDIRLDPSETHCAFIPVSGTAMNVKVFAVKF